MPPDPMYSRRTALALAAAAILPLPRRADGSAQQADSLVARLRQPAMAGRPRAPVTDYENDPFIIGVEERLRCTCGCNLDVYTCRTTDFTCATSPAMHRQVVSLVEEGKSAEEILDAFVAEYGEMVLMAPRKEGFNIVGYVLPGIAITGVGAAMLWVLTRKIRLRTAAVEAATSEGGDPSLSPDDAARLEAELAELE